MWIPNYFQIVCFSNINNKLLVKSTISDSVREGKDFLCILEFVGRALGIPCSNPTHKAQHGVQCKLCIGEAIEHFGVRANTDKDMYSVFKSILNYGTVSI